MDRLIIQSQSNKVNNAVLVGCYVSVVCALSRRHKLFSKHVFMSAHVSCVFMVPHVYKIIKNHKNRGVSETQSPPSFDSTNQLQCRDVKPCNIFLTQYSCLFHTLPSPAFLSGDVRVHAMHVRIAKSKWSHITFHENSPDIGTTF